MCDLTVMECNPSTLIQILVIDILVLSVHSDHQLAFSAQSLLFDLILDFLEDFGF